MAYNQQQPYNHQDINISLQSTDRSQQRDNLLSSNQQPIYQHNPQYPQYPQQQPVYQNNNLYQMRPQPTPAVEYRSLSPAKNVIVITKTPEQVEYQRQLLKNQNDREQRCCLILCCCAVLEICLIC